MYCVIYGNYRNLSPKISHIFKKKALVFSFICSKCENEDDKYLKKN